jgi:hypothetical protein
VPFIEITAEHSESHKTTVNTVDGQNAGLINVKIDHTYS